MKSTGSQSATIIHTQVDASKLNKKSSKCVKTKSDKEDIIVNQKTRILNLENEIKQLKKVVDTYTRTGPNAATTRENTDGVQPATYHNPNHQPNQPATMQDLLEHRMRILETQMMQTMCINTAIHTQIALVSLTSKSVHWPEWSPGLSVPCTSSSLHSTICSNVSTAYKSATCLLFTKHTATYTANKFWICTSSTSSSTDVCQIRISTTTTSTYQTISSPSWKATICSAP